MNNYGKVLAYDGYIGNIIDKAGIKYIFTSKDLKDTKISEGDMVSFKYEILETVEIKEYLARSIKKVLDEKKESAN